MRRAALTLVAAVPAPPSAASPASTRLAGVLYEGWQAPAFHALERVAAAGGVEAGVEPV